MIPQFLEFKKLELSDKKDVESFSSLYPPYSDFNFVSMWSWNTKDEMLLSELYGNLVVRFTDYVDNKPFYSFLGNNETEKTIDALIELSKKEGLEEKLKLVPENSIKSLSTAKYSMGEDPDNFDYIYDIHSLSLYKGPELSKKRNQAASFAKNFPDTRTEVFDLENKTVKQEILKLDEEWLKQKMGKKADYEANNNELLAIERFFQSEMSKIVGIGIYNDVKLIGYSIFEILPDKYCICHFSKVNGDFKYINDYLMKESAKILESRGCSFLNFEQDLGRPDLRFSKNSFRPSSFLKKYIIVK